MMRRLSDTTFAAALASPDALSPERELARCPSIMKIIATQKTASHVAMRVDDDSMPICCPPVHDFSRAHVKPELS
jgi:hypothetical protein